MLMCVNTCSSYLISLFNYLVNVSTSYSTITLKNIGLHKQIQNFSFFILMYTDSCDVTLMRSSVELDQESLQIFCQLGSPQWTRIDGSDFCAANTEYSRCGGKNLCTIPRDDFLSGELTFFCCHSGTGRICWQIISE